MATDAISSLPDELLHQILSFLPDTRSRAATSILSKRWKYLWINHPDIKLTMKFCHDLSDIATAHIAAVDSCFAAVHRYRCLVKEPVRSLDLDLWLPSSCSQTVACSYAATASRWLEEAARLSVRQLHLQVRAYWREPHDPIPSSLFCCSYLSELHINSKILPKVPSNFCGFPNLKKLELIGATIEDDNLRDLLAGCPLLEHLILNDCRGLIHLEIPSELQRLHVLQLTDIYPVSVRVRAPGLTKMSFQGNLVSLSCRKLPCLAMAALRFTIDERFHNQKDWLDLLLAISCTGTLEVDHLFYRFMIPKDYSRGIYSPRFKNLKELECHMDWFTFQAIQCFTSNLGECPSLETLRILLGRDARWYPEYKLLNAYADMSSNRYQSLKYLNELLKYGENDWDAEDDFLKYGEANYEKEDHLLLEKLGEVDYSLPRLKVFIVHTFLGTENEMQLIKSVLANAMMLESFVLIDSLFQSEWEINEFLSPLRRASPHVQMMLHRTEKFTEEFLLLRKSDFSS